MKSSSTERQYCSIALEIVWERHDQQTLDNFNALNQHFGELREESSLLILV
jgi:hypothetical protein